MNAISFLSNQVPVFAGIAEGRLAPLLDAAKFHVLRPGETIIRAGTVVDSLQVVAAGNIEVYKKGPYNKFVIVAKLGLGEVFGESSILEQVVASATLKAGEEGGEVLLIPERPLLLLIHENAELKARFTALIESRRPVVFKPKPAIDDIAPQMKRPDGG